MIGSILGLVVVNRKEEFLILFTLNHIIVCSAVNGTKCKENVLGIAIIVSLDKLCDAQF